MAERGYFIGSDVMRQLNCYVQKCIFKLCNNVVIHINIDVNMLAWIILK